MNHFYFFSKKEKFIMWLKGLAVVALFAYFFYRSLWALVVLIPLAFVVRKVAIRKALRLKQEEMRREFKEAIEVIAGNLRAGYSVENAFLETSRELARTRKVETPIVLMLTFIRKGLENNIPLDVRLKEAGKVSDVPEIVEFAEVFAVAKHSGGNVIDLIGQFISMIGDKIETEKEINVLLSARRGEQKIMNVIPFVILAYLEVSSPGFFASLYHNLTGIMVMTVCMGLYLGAYLLSVKMLEITL